MIPAIGECPEQFAQLCAAVRRKLCPKGALEHRLADRVALILWRFDRITRYEAATLASAIAATTTLSPNPDTITGSEVDTCLRLPPDAPPSTPALESVAGLTSGICSEARLWRWRETAIKNGKK